MTADHGQSGPRECSSPRCTLDEFEGTTTTSVKVVDAYVASMVAPGGPKLVICHAGGEDTLQATALGYVHIVIHVPHGCEGAATTGIRRVSARGRQGQPLD